MAELPVGEWRVTPETARLLQHWRHHPFAGVKPFFCQVEAVETAIWLTEVAPQIGRVGDNFVEHLAAVNADANPGLARLALKLATGAGKTTVMAMLIAWQTINAVKRPGSKRFTKGFLIVTPGLTIRDRLRVLQPNDPDSYYASRELVPTDLLDDLNRARIVITNYHAFKRRERFELSKGGRAFLAGRTGEEPATVESEGQMLQRVCPDLMDLSQVVVINDEAHHCYREKGRSDEEVAALSADEKAEAKDNAEAARLWIGGIEAVQRTIGVSRVMDLSATPFFLAGSGYVEGTLFPWTMSDFSLMDAIESGIVKLPRVPIADNLNVSDMPMYRELWKHIGAQMPKKGRGRRPGSIRTSCRHRWSPHSTRSVATTRARSCSGATLGCACRRASSWSATIRRPRSSSTTTSRASSARTTMALAASKPAGSSCFATMTSTATGSRGRARCWSTASSSNRARRSTMRFAASRPTRSRASARNRPPHR